jgi:arylsulfatase A-like enzyme
MPAEPAVPATSRIHRIASWVAPSAAAAGAAAVVAGLIEGILTGDGAVEVLATAAFSTLVAAPAALGVAVVLRVLWAVWRPARLAAVLVDDRGAAPRLGAWVGFLGIAALVLSWATFNTVRWLAIASSFHPVVVSLVLPIVVVAVATGLAALSRPLVDVLDAGLARLERRRATRGRRPLVTPRTIAATVVVGATAVAAISWFFSIRPRIGHFDLVVFVHPLIAIALIAAGHAAWRRWPRVRAPGGIAAAALALALAAGALWVRTSRPSLLLEVWSRPTVAGLSIDELFDLDAVRSEMTLTAFRPTARPAARHPDVVLITIDTVRQDRTPLAPGGPARMPVLAALGARGAVFDWAFSPGNVTRRSIPSIVLGDSATRVRGRVAGWALRLDPRHVLLAERFKAAGYDTAAFVCCASFWAPRHKLGINRGLDHLYIDESGRALSEAARAWLEERDSTHPRRPLFMWMHFIEVHNWNGDHPHPSFTEADRKRYDRVLSEVDHYLGTVVTAFAQRPPGDQPIFVITADHGEGLGDHGVPYHSDGMYDSQIHVPLVIAGPGVQHRHINEPVSLIDLAPTMLDLAGFEPPGLPEMDGRSIADLVTGARNPDPDRGYAFSAQIKDRSVATGERALIVGPWKLIFDGRTYELYDLRTDPAELHDLADEAPHQLIRMKHLLDARAKLDATPPFP